MAVEGRRPEARPELAVEDAAQAEMAVAVLGPSWFGLLAVRRWAP